MSLQHLNLQHDTNKAPKSIRTYRMHELISQPGLKFYLFQLLGTQSYSVERPGSRLQTGTLSTDVHRNEGGI